MSSATPSLETLKQTVLPDLFANPVRISDYGNDLDATRSIDQLSNLLQQGGASRLVEHISQMLGSMADASPKALDQRPTWWSRYSGLNLERHLRFQVARKKLDRMLTETEVRVQSVRDTICQLDRLIADHDDDVRAIRTYIQAGREFLDEHPDVGSVASNELQLERPRERLARKLANFATLLVSHELSIKQMQLARAQAMDLLDRIGETVSLLVPVWRQHSLALISTQNVDSAMIAQAAEAHQELMKSLACSLETSAAQ